MAQFSGVAGDLRDPYPVFRAKRTESPVEHMADGGYEIYPYELVSRVMRDHETFPSGSIREFMSVVMGPYPLVGMDEPEHRRLRSARGAGVPPPACSCTGTRTSWSRSSTR